MNAHKTTLLIALSLLLASCSGLEEVTGEDRKFQEVREHSQSQDVAFSRISRWVAQAYGSANEAVQMSNEDTGTFIIKGSNSTTGAGRYLDYTLTMDVRDEKVRFTYNVTGADQNTVGAKYYRKKDKSYMREDFQSIQTSVLNAIEQQDDF